MQDYKNPIYRKAVAALESLMVDSEIMMAQSADQRERFNPEAYQAAETERRNNWQERYKHIWENEIRELKKEAERINEAKRAAALNLDGCEKEIFLLNNSENLTEKDIALLAKKHPDKHLYLSALVKYAEAHNLNTRAPEIVGVSVMASQATPSTLSDPGAYLHHFTRHLNRMRGYESSAAELKIYQAIDAAGVFASVEQQYFSE